VPDAASFSTAYARVVSNSRYRGWAAVGRLETRDLATNWLKKISGYVGIIRAAGDGAGALKRERSPPDDAGRLRRKMSICRFFPRGRLFWSHRRADHRRDKAVASPGNIRDIRLTLRAITEGTPQLGDVEAQIALVNG
jgi:hypothetical protein